MTAESGEKSENLGPKMFGNGFWLEWHLNFCKSWRAKLIWIEKAVLAKRVL